MAGSTLTPSVKRVKEKLSKQTVKTPMVLKRLL